MTMIIFKIEPILYHNKTKTSHKTMQQEPMVLNNNSRMLNLTTKHLVKTSQATYSWRR